MYDRTARWTSTAKCSSSFYFTWYLHIIVCLLLRSTPVLYFYTHTLRAPVCHHSGGVCLTHVTWRYYIPPAVLGGLHVCAVTRPDPPKPARPPWRLPASNRPRTQECRERRALWAESWERTHRVSALVLVALGFLIYSQSKTMITVNKVLSSF